MTDEAKRPTVLGVAVVLFALVGFSCPWLDRSFHTPLTRNKQDQQVVVIPKGLGACQVASLLEERGLIRRASTFYLLALLKGKQGHLSAGEYRLSPGMTPAEILETLSQGKVLLHSVTLPEGITVQDVARLLEGRGLARSARILALSQDRGVLASWGIQADSLEGYLFPETYYFPRGVPETEILRTMVRTFARRFSPADGERARQLGLSWHQAVTLASLIEKEAKEPAERSLISAVYHNRLKQGMRLQCDPTVIYALGERFVGNLTRQDLTMDSPYNTYLYPGLPPGPICNPGKESLRAALYPAQTDALYFVSRNNGWHQFSTTLEEHNRAVLSYQPKRGLAP
ncbi:MAG: endolytic transglycosylase MltG [Candidatus Tectomicrobia bacterium]|uniref:Endolytic murein transglycosylase n=1 Tax=Tectimicrobiota bacterium TaxID=2528274 RepID=A0A932CLG2_UNCTE|nr:endolytic transglycosylase MltG [Candidatus Tectomicrobia bacterium]